MASSAIIHNSLRVLNASNFVHVYDSDPTVTDYLYIGIAGQTAWANEVVPPTPTIALDEKGTFWSDFIGIHRVQVIDVALCAPRINWTDSQEFFVFDTAATANPWDVATPTYCLASNNNVYRCINKVPAEVAAAPLNIEPTGTGSAIITGDGYTWEFLYDLTALDVQNLLTDAWLPVNWGTKMTATQIASGRTDAIQLLNASNMMVRAQVTDTDLPVDVVYRKVALISNPVLADGVTRCTANNYTAASGLITSGSGDLVYMEHRPPITRNVGQSEEIKMVVEF